MHPPHSHHSQASAFLSNVLQARLSDEAWQWCKQQADNIAQSDEQSDVHTISHKQQQRQLHIAFSSAVRYCGKNALRLNADELAAAHELCPHWQPLHWTTDIAARTLLIVNIPHDDGGGGDKAYQQSLDALFQSADLNESIALYSCLPLLLMAHSHVQRAGEGLRSNVQAIFTAIAHNSPFPQLHFAENNWNQMILKALFIDVPLYPIVGLDDRANPALTRMLCDYAHERWAASRAINPELWRCVGYCADQQALTDLEKLIQSENLIEQQAAALALQSSSLAGAQKILKQHPHRLRELHDGLQWSSLIPR